MFPQSARVNGFQNELTTSERFPESVTLDSSGNVSFKTTYLQPNRNYPSALWGTMSGDRVPYINNAREVGKENQVRLFAQGTDCPQSDKIYGEQCGVQLADFILYNEDNWSSSLWQTLGFSYKTLNPTAWVGIRNQRNFTKNFLQAEITDNYAVNVFHTQSFPLTTNCSISSAGFIPNTANLIGEVNGSLTTPTNSLFFTGNIQSQNFKSYTVESLTQEDADNIAGGEIVFSRDGGANLINNELFFYEFFNLKIDSTQAYGSYILADSVPSKIEQPVYFVKSDIVENNYAFCNNANNTYPAQMPVIGAIGLQYSSSSDFYFSSNQLETSFVNKKKRVITSISIELVDSNGQLASTLLEKSSIFIRITRADPVYKPLTQAENLEYDEEEFKKNDKKDFKKYEEQVDAYLGLLE